MHQLLYKFEFFPIILIVTPFLIVLCFEKCLLDLVIPAGEHHFLGGQELPAAREGKLAGVPGLQTE